MGWLSSHCQSSVVVLSEISVSSLLGCEKEAETARFQLLGKPYWTVIEERNDLLPELIAEMIKQVFFASLSAALFDGPAL